MTPKWQSPQMTLSAHKRSSTSDTHQNQLAKCPNITSCSKEKSARVHTGGLTRSWSSSAHPDACFHSTKEKRYVGSQRRAGEKQGGSPKQMVSAAARSVPQIPLSGPTSQSSELIATIPARDATARGSAPEIPGSQMSREHSPALGAAKLLPKVEASCPPLKQPTKRQGWWKGGWLYLLVCLFIYLLHLYWSITALQYCVSFCCITK